MERHCPLSDGEHRLRLWCPATLAMGGWHLAVAQMVTTMHDMVCDDDCVCSRRRSMLLCARLIRSPLQIEEATSTARRTWPSVTPPTIAVHSPVPYDLVLALITFRRIGSEAMNRHHPGGQCPGRMYNQMTHTTSPVLTAPDRWLSCSGRTPCLTRRYRSTASVKTPGPVQSSFREQPS